MAIRFHYRTISSYRELPPRVRILYSEDRARQPNSGLVEVDGIIRDARARLPSYITPHDIVSQVFGSRTLAHELTSRQLSSLIEERRGMNEKHLADVRRRLAELLERKPWRGGPSAYHDTEVTDVERQILDLEKQRRALEVALWRDTQELRTTLMEERREQEAMKQRMGYLVGGTDGP